ncbi:phytanoyl-CoA dioxygenase, peroxisomal-like [Danaus plexippus]|uniref:phytanoyl-CoA dioxygenase, peroxisomal-like n=1 Tax=Danaus plexippus TaxID=13037 RepID=UPI002AB069D7|nr:phytanoyl-CoA dioxygenase, peroxisomal-like [Danaus plexippus]
MLSDKSNTYKLSEEQKQFYEDNGYLVIKELFDFATLYNIKKRFQDICKGTVDKGNALVYKEPALVAKGLKGEDAINKISELQHDEVFSTFSEDPRLLHILSQFLGGDVSVMSSMVINKPPGSARHPPHQDLYYFPFRPAEKIIAAWTAIDDVTVDNGCLYVVPKSHKNNILYRHGNLLESNKLFHGILEAAAPCEPRVCLEMSPGDTVFFHPLIVHGSGENRTQRYRKCITGHFASPACYFIDVTGTVQEALKDEIEEEIRKYGFTFSFQDFFKYKSKVVLRSSSKL